MLYTKLSAWKKFAAFLILTGKMPTGAIFEKVRQLRVSFVDNSKVCFYILQCFPTTKVPYMKQQQKAIWGNNKKHAPLQSLPSNVAWPTCTCHLQFATDLYQSIKQVIAMTQTYPPDIRNQNENPLKNVSANKIEFNYV